MARAAGAQPAAAPPVPAPAQPTPATSGAPGAEAPPPSSPSEGAQPAPPPVVAQPAPPASGADAANGPGAAPRARVPGQGAWDSSGPVEPDPSEAPASQEKRPARGLTKAGIPLGRRGMIGLDTASFTADGSGESDFVSNRTTTVALVVASSLPLSPTGFIDVRLPLGLQRRGEFMLGNIMLGGHGISKIGKRVWLIGGGQLGLPTFSSNSQRASEIGESPLVGRIGWDAQEYAPDMIPFMGSIAVEAHFGEEGLFRADLAPIIGMQIGDASNDGVFFIFQHSAEIQYGHDLGGGLRIQGLAPVDGYQLAIEPFFAWENERAFLRAGMMLPLTAPFGPPIKGSWGARIALGTRL